MKDGDWLNLWQWAKTLYPKTTMAMEGWYLGHASAAFIERVIKIAARNNPKLARWELTEAIEQSLLDRQAAQRLAILTLRDTWLPYRLRNELQRGGWQITAHDASGTLHTITARDFGVIDIIFHDSRLRIDGRDFTSVRVRRLHSDTAGDLPEDGAAMNLDTQTATAPAEEKFSQGPQAVETALSPLREDRATLPAPVVAPTSVIAATSLRRPTRTGFGIADEKLFVPILELTKSGEATSATDAVRIIAKSQRLPGRGDEAARVKRIVAGFHSWQRKREI